MKYNKLTLSCFRTRRQGVYSKYIVLITEIYQMRPWLKPQPQFCPIVHGRQLCGLLPVDINEENVAWGLHGRKCIKLQYAPYEVVA